MTLILTAAVLLSFAAVFALPARRLRPVKAVTSDQYGELSKKASR